MFGKQGGSKTNPDFPPTIGVNPGEPKRPDVPSENTSAKAASVHPAGTGNNDKWKAK